MNMAGIARKIQRSGADATLRRISPARGIYYDVTVRAFVRDYQPEELSGGILQGDRHAVISDVEITARRWPGPPRKGDQLIMDGRTTTVQGCETRTVGNAVAMHVLQLRGS
jgi:hypothetical protein